MQKHAQQFRGWEGGRSGEKRGMCVRIDRTRETDGWDRDRGMGPGAKLKGVAADEGGCASGVKQNGARGVEIGGWLPAWDRWEEKRGGSSADQSAWLCSRLTAIEMESEIRGEFQCVAIRARKAVFGARWNGMMGVCAGIEVDGELDDLRKFAERVVRIFFYSLPVLIIFHSKFIFAVYTYI